MTTVDELTVTGASLDEWHQAVEWAAAESWNPGRGDAACFHSVDPAGFFLGRARGRTLSAISVVNYSPEYAFLGYYLVHPEHRGNGLGLATWRAAVPHAGDRTVGLDGVPAQQAVYERAGFTAAYRTLRYTGRPVRNGGSGEGAEPVTAGSVDEIAAYDRGCFPAERRGFLERWLTAPGHSAYVRRNGSTVTGYGVIRPARAGWRIGPLFADSPEDAAALFDALTADLAPDEAVTLDIPEPSTAAAGLAEERGMALGSYTVRMYAGPAPAVGPERTYGVTSLELG